MVSETEAIAELSCTREHPSLIHYAARHGQVSDSAHTPQERSSGHVTNHGSCVAGARPAVAAAVHAGTGHFSGRGGSERELGGSRGGSVRPSQLRSGAPLILSALILSGMQ